MAWWRTIGTVASHKSVLAVVAAGLLYFWWVTTQYERINEFNQRQLASAALVLQNTIETAVKNVRNYKYVAGRAAADGTPADADAAQVCTFDNSQPYLSLDDCKLLAGYTGGFEAPEFSSEHLAVVAARSGQQAKTLEFKLQVAGLLDELSYTDAFDLVFIANGAGVVRYQENPAARRWRSRLRWGERTFKDDTASQSAGIRLYDVSQLLGADAWKRAGSVSGRTDVTLGGQPSVLYLQPLAVDSMAGGGSLVLGAVAPSRTLMWRALAMDTYFVALLVCLLLFALLGIPFIKLASLHPHERMTLRDVRNLYVSAAGLLALWIFGALAVDHYLRWQATADAGVEAFAGDISARIETELRDALRTLDRYDDAVLRRRDTLEGKTMLADWFGQTGDAPADARPAMHDRAYDEFPLGPSLFMERATWIGPDGWQTWKITADKTAKRVEVRERPYFQAVREGNLYRLAGEGPCFFIAPDRSITDGKFYTFVSMRSRLSLPASVPAAAEGLTPFDTCADGPNSDTYVAVATMKLLSVLRPPLPVGYGFVLVNRDGRTMYHSDPRLALREQFFTELGDESAARALALSGTDAWLTTSYRERPHRLYFRPLSLERAEPSGLPADQREEHRGFSGLYVVVFRDVSIEQAVVARAFLIGLAGPLLGLLAVVWLAIWGVGRVSRRQDGRWSHWLWANGAQESLHKTLSGVTVGILTASALLYAWTPIGPAVFLALPLVTAAAGIGVYAAGHWRGKHRTRLRAPWWYSLKFGLLFVCLVGVPAATLFSQTLGHQFGKLIDSEEHALWAQIDDMVLALQSEVRHDQYPGWYGRFAADAARQRLGSWPAPFNEDVPHDAADRASWLVNSYAWLDAQLPVRSELTARQWNDDSRFAYMPPGRWGLPIGPVALVALLLACALLVAWIRWCAGHLLLADVDAAAHSGEGTPAQAWAGCEPTERFVLMQVTAEHIANPRQRPVVLALIKKGLLVLAPDLRPSTSELEAYVHKQAAGSAELTNWEAAAGERSWHSVRLALFGTLVVGGIFLVTTQPGLQSDLAGLASGIVAMGGMAVKVRDTITQWIDTTRAPR